jgi:hypothetical protein
VSELPPRPSLAHLRKQAKDLLRRFRQQNPDAKLADAQHALAGEYGFSSWPTLKAHAESLVERAQPPTFHRYTSKAKEAVFFSRCEASDSRSSTIEPEHLLLGLIRASQGLKGRMFEPIALSLDRARGEIVQRPQETVASAPAAAGERARMVFRAAAEEADALHHQDIGLAHILLGVLRERDSVAATLLDRNGLHLQFVRDGIAGFLDEEPV